MSRTQVQANFCSQRSTKALWLSIGLRRFSYLYFVVMFLRYVLTMALFSERRWFGGAILIFVHWVLTTYLFVWSGSHSRPVVASA